ncbi:small ribosomal subunit protein uS3m-like [Vicugna pacos]|uniref:Small ribosomal subunit protein uS3m-like n=1 Tax=Vicugna pacos TaxID=30538 RepID=A0ABM5CSJ2_VICPA
MAKKKVEVPWEPGKELLFELMTPGLRSAEPGVREAGGSARGDRWVSVGGGGGTAHGAVSLPVSQALIVALGSPSTDGWSWRHSIQGGKVHPLLNPVSIFRAINRAARVRVGKGDKPVTYEEAHSPHYIAHRKGWLSLHTSNLDGEEHAAERTVEDVFLRKFMLGTFPGCLADQLVLKRWANQLEICALVLRQLPAHKFYFLVGYSETLLSHFYKCPVRLHLQTVPSKVVYKYI